MTVLPTTGVGRGSARRGPGTGCLAQGAAGLPSETVVKTTRFQNRPRFLRDLDSYIYARQRSSSALFELRPRSGQIPDRHSLFLQTLTDKYLDEALFKCLPLPGFCESRLLVRAVAVPVKCFAPIQRCG